MEIWIADAFDSIKPTTKTIHFSDGRTQKVTDFGYPFPVLPAMPTAEELDKEIKELKEAIKKVMKEFYNPNPIDTSDIQLPEELEALGESIAENVHDVWSAGRIADGWAYGETRNDELKTHPCLVPYSQLSDSEKAYDRNTAFETLKLICKLGYKITKGD